MIMMDYVFSLVTSDGETILYWTGRSVGHPRSSVKWRNASDGVAQATLKQLYAFVAAFWSCFVPVWTFL